MEHKYVGMQNFISTANELKDALIELYKKDGTLQQFRKVYEDFNLVVDDGHYEVFSLHKKAHIPFNRAAEDMALTTLSISDLYYQNLRDRPEPLNNVSSSSTLSSTSLKEDINKIVKEYRANYADIKAIPNNNMVGNLKSSMFVNAYEKTESELSKVFNKYGVTTSYEQNKAIIKASKYVEKFPIGVFVNVNNLVSRFIHESNILAQNTNDISNNKDLLMDKKDKKRGIFIA